MGKGRCNAGEGGRSVYFKFVLKRRMPELEVINVSKSASGARLATVEKSERRYKNDFGEDALWMIHGLKKANDVTSH